MLLKIVFPKDNDEFKEVLLKIERSIWPNDEYITAVKDIAIDLNGPIEIVRKRISDALNEIVDDISNKPLYIFYDRNKGGSYEMKMPFLDHLHKLFLVRKWDHDPGHLVGGNKEELVSLKRNDNGKNSSLNEENFNHFSNVIAAAARLINFFSVEENLYKIFGESICRELINYLKFDKNVLKRIFILMLGAYYHDLGKTIVNRRHALEGSIIISDHVTNSWNKLWKIAKEYNLSFDQEDLMFISDLLLFHDLFGVLSTGECGFAKAIDLIEKIKQYSRNDNSNEYPKKILFDLWILNVADIIVSIKDKGQPATWLQDDKSAGVKIYDFFYKGRKGRILMHDFNVCCDLVESLDNKRHSDDIESLEKKAYRSAKRHTVERINRLIRASINCYISKEQTVVLNENAKEFIKQIELNTPSTIDCFEPIIKDAIMHHSDFQSFCNSLSFIGQMDYSLGFFASITGHAIKEVVKEINGERAPTRWIRPIDLNPFGTSAKDKERYWNVQFCFFIRNLSAIFIQILTHVLYREKCFDSFRNLEFSDATERLTEEKIENLLYFDGPAWSKRSTHSILQCIFYW